MTKRFSIASAVLTLFAAILASLLVVAVPAFAGPSGGGGGQSDTKQAERDRDGDADSDPDTTVDESEADESTADEGDNQHPSGKDRSVENSPSSNPNQGKAESNPDDSRGPRRSEGVAGEDDKPNAGGGEDPADQDGNNGCGNDDDFDDDNNGWCGKPVDDEVDSDDEGPCDKDNDMSNGVQKCEDEEPPCDKDNDMSNGVQKCESDNHKPCDKDNDMSNGVQKCEDDEVEGEVIDKPCDADGNMANGVQSCEDDDKTCPTDVTMSADDVRCDDVTLGDFEAKPLPDAPEVLGTRFAAGLTRPALTKPAVSPRVIRGGRVGGGVLPFTGSEPLGLLLIGLGILASGAVTVAATRK